MNLTPKEWYIKIRESLAFMKCQAVEIPDPELAKKIRRIYDEVDEKNISLPDEKPVSQFNMVLAQEHFKDDPETLASIEKIKDKVSLLRYFFKGEIVYLVFNPDIQRAELEILEDTARKVASAATG